MHTSYDVYAIGNALVDVEFRVSDEFLTQNNIQKGMMTLVEEAPQQALIANLEKAYGLTKRASGGSAANTIIALSYFGGRAFYSCKVANDATGDFYMKDLHAAGVDSNLGDEREAGISGTCVVMVTPDTERTMNTFLGITSDVSVKELVPSAIAASKWLYIEGYLCTSDSARAAVLEARRIARGNGVGIALTFSDPAMAQFFQPQLAEMVADGVDLLFCNEEEARAYSKTESTAAALDALKAVAKRIVITQSKDGALLWDGQNTIKIAPAPAQPIDTLGAGDTFAGAFLYGESQGWDMEKSGRLAAQAAAAVVSQFGPRLSAADHQALLAQFN